MKKDLVFSLCETMLRNSPERSFKRLNPALRDTLSNCISADLPFQPDTFQRIYNELRGGRWFGDGAGSYVGENFYTHACDCNHASAQQSFEQFAGRPGVLWEEDINTPERLHVGSQFTWQGYFVTVTSMRTDRLVACTYKAYESRIEGLKAGAVIGYDSGHLITSAKRDGKATVLRVIPVAGSNDQSVPARRFNVTYAQIAELRHSAKARLKAMLKRIATCDPDKDAIKLTKAVNAEHFRHFELEEIQAAFLKRKEWQTAEGRIEAWRSGADESWLDSKLTLLRVKDDRVECSNGNFIRKVTAQAVLPVLLEHRRQTAALSVPVDSYCINRVNAEGVQIGCTLVPWTEIERLVPELH